MKIRIQYVVEKESLSCQMKMNRDATLLSVKQNCIKVNKKNTYIKRITFVIL